MKTVKISVSKQNNWWVAREVQRTYSWNVFLIILSAFYFHLFCYCTGKIYVDLYVTFRGDTSYCFEVAVAPPPHFKCCNPNPQCAPTIFLNIHGCQWLAKCFSCAKYKEEIVIVGGWGCPPHQL